jgi:hypothetical protein
MVSSRNQRRLQQKSQKKPPQPRAVANPLEVSHLRRLEADIEQLGKAFNHNAQLFQHALTIAEMRIRVLERALHDSVRGTLQLKEIDGLKHVDFESYVTEFAMCMVLSECAENIRKNFSLEDNGKGHTTNGKSIITPLADEGDTIVFGGNP